MSRSRGSPARAAPRSSSSRSCRICCLPGGHLRGTVSAAILASIGLEVLGLGPIEANTLGMTLYWVNYYAALLHGLWWWFLPPVIIINTGLTLNTRWPPVRAVRRQQVPTMK